MSWDCQLVTFSVKSYSNLTNKLIFLSLINFLISTLPSVTKSPRLLFLFFLHRCSSPLSHILFLSSIFVFLLLFFFSFCSAFSVTVVLPLYAKDKNWEENLFATRDELKCLENLFKILVLNIILIFTCLAAFIMVCFLSFVGPMISSFTFQETRP